VAKAVLEAVVVAADGGRLCLALMGGRSAWRRRALMAALLLAWVPLEADATFDTRLNGYAGSDGVSVLSPQENVHADLDDRTQVALRYGVDAVSAASFNYARSKTHLADPRRSVGNCKSCHNGVDAISGASRNYRDARQELGVSVVRHVGETDLTPSYIRSQEDDYLSQTLGLGLTQNLFDRDTIVGLELMHSDNQSDAVWNKALVRESTTDTATLSLTQILTRLNEFRLNAELSDPRGYMANPYAFVQIGDITAQPVFENEPTFRGQRILGAAFKQSLGRESSMEFDYRYYNDTWGVTSNTLRAQVDKQIGPFTLEASWRRYAQTQAWFFQNFYLQGQEYMTRDLKLAAFNDDLYGLALRGKVSENVDMDLSYAHYVRHDKLDYRLYYANGPVTSDMWSLGFTYH